METTHDSEPAAETRNGSSRLQVLLGVVIVLAILGWVFRGLIWKMIQAFMLNVLESNSYEPPPGNDKQ